MSYYPILSAPNCIGFTTISNFPPNNWEGIRQQRRLVNLTWSDNDLWHSVTLDELEFNSMRTFRRVDIEAYLPSDALPLLSLSAEPLPKQSETLPINMNGTYLPAWRATLGLMSQLSSTSYQGELDPFPTPASLLTFPPLIQYGFEIENYMLFLNLERRANLRVAAIEIYKSADPGHLIDKVEVRNNNVSVVSLDKYKFNPSDLPVFVCRDMTAIPLYFSKTRDGAFLSLEHTHPPVSYVVHGNRWGAQKILKARWFSKLGQK
jgi:hypothetical protein